MVSEVSKGQVDKGEDCFTMPEFFFGRHSGWCFSRVMPLRPPYLELVVVGNKHSL
jgi:hypothetical protein